MIQPILETAGKAAVVAASSSVSTPFSIFRSVSAFALHKPAAMSAAVTAVSSLRGGSLGCASGEPFSAAAVAAMESFDINRVKIRLEGLSSYGVIAALLMNTGMRLYSSTPKNVEFGKSKRMDNIAKMLFCASVIISILAGIHTTVVFSLLGLYSKTALGLGCDLPYLEFMEKTSGIRAYAFDSFVVSLVSFQVAFATSLFINYKGRMKWVATSLAVAMALVSFWHWGFVMEMARKLLFS